jgi:hypothetical protein
MPYGYPESATKRVWEVVLNLPVVIADVEHTAERPAVYALGPLAADLQAEGAARTVPASFEIKGKTLSFRFSKGLAQGTYNVVVHTSRIHPKAGGQLELLGADGLPWHGWLLSVVIDDVEPPVEVSMPEPEAGDGGEAYRALDTFRILLDGKPVPSGSSELSGADLAVVLPGPALSVEIRVEPLGRNAAETLYEAYLHQQVETPAGPDGEHMYHHRAIGPIGAMRWALYHGHTTEGRMVLGTDGRFPVGEAVLAPPGDDGVAQFDLPVNRRLSIYVDGVRVWWGQTRLLPLLVSAERYSLMTHGHGTHELSPAEVADMRLLIWRASQEALTLWKCLLPAAIPASIEDYVVTRLAYGWPLEDQMVGEVFVRLGDQAYRGKTDGALVGRLRTLAHTLMSCETDVALFPEDKMPIGHARLAADAHPSFHPERRPYESPVPLFPVDHRPPERTSSPYTRPHRRWE